MDQSFKMLRDFIEAVREMPPPPFTVDYGSIFKAQYTDNYYYHGQLVIRVIPMGETQADRWQNFLGLQTMLHSMGEFFTAHYDAQGMRIIVPR